MKLLIDTWFNGLADNAAHEQRLAPLPKRWQRYAPATKACWLAVADALAQTKPNEPQRIGCVVAGLEGCHAENTAYFSDYLEGGRTLGRSALFIHTLPTSSAAECGLHFGLGGPLLYALAEDGRLEDALALAESCLSQDGVDMMLVLPQFKHCAGCLALTRGEGLAPEWQDFQIEKTETMA